MQSKTSLMVAVFLCTTICAAEPITLANVAEPPPPSANEPFIREFSLQRAAQALDSSALHWQKTRKCAACHTLPPYLMARPLLNAVSPEPPEVRNFFETVVEQRLEGEPALPKDGLSAVVIEVAAALVFHDRATTGKLHARTRQELERMWSLQRADGSWQWPFRDTPPIKSDEQYGAAMAALAAGAAPDNYARSDRASEGLARTRKFLKAKPPASLHQKAMLLWTSSFVEEILTPSEKVQFAAQLSAAQRPDGGWSMASLVENPADLEHQSSEARQLRQEKGHGSEFLVYAGRDKAYRSSLDSDGYATGFTIFVLRQAGSPATDAGLRRGIAWLKSHQGESGRWFTPSQSSSTQHRIANAGTAFAVLALHACGEIPSREK